MAHPQTPFYESTAWPAQKGPVRVLHMVHEKSEAGCGLHWHEAIEFYYVISGGVLLYGGQDSHWLYPGDVGVVPGFLPHRGRLFLPKSEHYILQVSPDFLSVEEDGLQRRFARGGSHALTIQQDGALMALFDHLLGEYTAARPGWQTACRGDMLRIFAHLYRACPPVAGETPAPAGFDTVRRILFFLSGHFDKEEEVTLPALCRRFGLSAPYLCRLFRQYTGLTVNGYVQEAKVSCGASLLRSGATVAEAARAAGVDDPSYFARLFRRRTGLSPGEWKKQCRLSETPPAGL